jgi:hypothetical protein
MSEKKKAKQVRGAHLLAHVIRAAYVYAYMHDSDVRVWVPRDDYGKLKPGWCSRFVLVREGGILVEEVRQGIMVMHSRVSLEKAKKFMKGHHGGTREVGSD